MNERTSRGLKIQRWTHLITGTHNRHMNHQAPTTSQLSYGEDFQLSVSAVCRSKAMRGAKRTRTIARGGGTELRKSAWTVSEGFPGINYNNSLVIEALY